MIGNSESQKEIGHYKIEENENITQEELDQITQISLNIFEDSRTQSYSKENFEFRLFKDIETQRRRKLVDENSQKSKNGKRNLKFCIQQQNKKIKRNELSFKQKIPKKTVSSKLSLDKNFSNGGNVYSSLIKEEDNENNKLNIINTQINEVKNEMKKGVKKILNNVTNMNFLNEKSVKIKDSSYSFQQDSAK